MPRFLLGYNSILVIFYNSREKFEMSSLCLFSHSLPFKIGTGKRFIGSVLSVQTFWDLRWDLVN